MFNSPSSGQQSGGGGALGAVSSIVGMIGPTVQAGMQAKDKSDYIEAFRRKELEQYQLQGKYRAAGIDSSAGGNTYGTTKRYQGGGAYDPYKNVQSEITAEGAAGIGRPIADVGISQIPGFGPLYGAVKGVADGIQGAYGRQWVGQDDATALEVYGSPGDTRTEAGAKGALGNLWKPDHEHAMESWTRAAETEDSGKKAGYAMEGLGDLIGLTTIPKMIKGAIDAEDLQASRERSARTSGSNMGGTSAGLVGRGEQFQDGTNMTALRDQQLPMGKYGGSMNKYGKGGMKEYGAGGMNYSDGIQRSNANAELEGDEIIMKTGGKKDVKVKGPSHEAGGVPVNLQQGDYVWSDHIKDPQSGKSMAELYQEFSRSGASEQEIQGLMAYQEQLAGRASGEGMDNMAKTGGLKKYQRGTRTPLIGPNAPRPTGLDLLSDPDFRKKEAMRVAAAEADKVIPKSKSASVPKPKKFSYDPIPPLHTDKNGNPIMARNSQEEGFAPTFESLLKLDKPGDPSKTPVNPYKDSELSTAHLMPKAKGSKTTDTLLKYAPELALLASGAINAALVPRSYDLPEVPAMPQISHTDVKLDRADNRADRARADRDFRASLNEVRVMGAGPGSMGKTQAARNQIARDLEQSSQNVRQLNVNVAAQEAKMNMEAELKRKLTNAEFKMMYDKLNLERGAALADFKIQRKNNIADAITAGVLGAAETYASQRYADAISGESGVGDRRLQDNDLLRGFYARINNKKERA
jgi:hypothetical protein